MNQQMRELCEELGISFGDLQEEVTRTADQDLLTGQTVTVMLTVAEQRVLRAALEIAAGL